VRARLTIRTLSQLVSVLAKKISGFLEVNFLLFCFEISCAGQNIGLLRFLLYLRCCSVALPFLKRAFLESWRGGKALRMVGHCV